MIKRINEFFIAWWHAATDPMTDEEWWDNQW
jgi:hypothetical protein